MVLPEPQINSQILALWIDVSRHHDPFLGNLRTNLNKGVPTCRISKLVKLQMRFITRCIHDISAGFRCVTWPKFGPQLASGQEKEIANNQWSYDREMLGCFPIDSEEMWYRNNWIVMTLLWCINETKIVEVSTLFQFLDVNRIVLVEMWTKWNTN